MISWSLNYEIGVKISSFFLLKAKIMVSKKSVRIVAFAQDCCLGAR